MKNNITFLIVDDDADDRTLFIDAVKEINNEIECRVAKNGQQALKLLRDVKHRLPDLIFLDIKMPELDGKKCLLEIKKDERLKYVPVIIYTTMNGVEESKELRAMGAFHFITKPRNADEIFYLISFVIDEHAKAARRL